MLIVRRAKLAAAAEALLVAATDVTDASGLKIGTMGDLETNWRRAEVLLLHAIAILRSPQVPDCAIPEGQHFLARDTVGNSITFPPDHASAGREPVKRAFPLPSLRPLAQTEEEGQQIADRLNGVMRPAAGRK